MSIEAKACPRCGHPTMIGNQAAGKWIAIGFIVLTAIGYAAFAAEHC